MSEGRLIQAALSATDAGAVLGRLMPDRAQPWLDDLQPLGRIERDGSEILVFSIIDLCLMVKSLLTPDDAVSSALLFVWMPIEDRALPWGERRLQLTTAADMHP